jgi:hypothetical protein
MVARQQAEAHPLCREQSLAVGACAGLCRSGMPERIGRIGWLRSRAWHRDFSSMQTTTAFSGGCR